MTQFQHFLIAYFILLVLWHAFFKKFFLYEDEVEACEEIIKKWLKK